MKKVALVMWVVDSLMKIGPGTAPPPNPQNTLRLECARNEWEAGQVAVRYDQSVKRLAVRATDLRRDGGDGLIEAKHVRCNFVGFIRIEHNTPNTADKELSCKAPCEVPDVLRADETVALEANRTQPIWVSVYVPKPTPAGVYRGSVEIDADGDKTTAPVELTVFDFEVPDERHLYVTNWFSPDNIATAHKVELWSEDFFRLLSAYAHNMAEHRENVFWLSPWLIKTVRETDGTLSFDYARFDRFVETFLKAGVDGRIEIQPVAHHAKGGWESTEIIPSTIDVMDRASGKTVKLPPDQGLGPFLIALQKHLDQRGWLNKAMIHITDEPAGHNADSYCKASEFVHRHAPGIKRIEAIETMYFDGALEVWVPKLSHLRNWYPWFEQARLKGNEMWFYICCHPTGTFMNRFLDCPLGKVRLLHWLNYRYELGGYLHWGWNHWQGNPFGVPPKNLPPGDTHVVYPGPSGPLNSVRWEVQRDSLEDYEYLWLLEQRQRQAAGRLGKPAQAFDPRSRGMELTRQMVRSFTDYERDTERLKAQRARLAREIEQAVQEPTVLVETLPPEDMVLVPGPIVMEVRGLTYPDAKAVVNGKTVTVEPDGTFRRQVFMGPDKKTITVDIERGGTKKQIVRRFVIEG